MSAIQPPPSTSFDDAMRLWEEAFERIEQDMTIKAAYISVALYAASLTSSSHPFVLACSSYISILEASVVAQIDEARQLQARIIEVLPANSAAPQAMRTDLSLLDFLYGTPSSPLTELEESPRKEVE